MKNFVFLLACVVLVQFEAVESASAHPRFHRGTVTFAVFYDGLTPYGEWIAIGGGIYAWRPVHVVVGWRPYTVGRWVWTDYGWYWVSDEPWGWAVYHYGRWYYDDFYGWLWIPGYDWAPAWVEWRYGGDYIGWAPLGPYAIFSIHWGIHYRTRWYTPVHWWSFVHCRYISSPHLHRYVYRPEQNTRYIGLTRTAGSVRYTGGRIVSRGPEREFVERQGNVRIEPVPVREVTGSPVERVVREGSREQIEVFRPRVEDRADDEATALRPPRVREESGRPLDLDTRKIDLRARASSNSDDMQRADELRVIPGEARSEGGRIQNRSADGMLKGPVDDNIRDREARKQEDKVRSLRDRQSDERTNERPSRKDDEAARTAPDRAPGRVFGPPRENGERTRDESYRIPRRESFGSPAYRPAPREPHRMAPQGRSEPPRSGTRDSGGRGGRGR